MPDNLKQKTVTGVSWSFIEQILARGVNFVIGIILARLLTPTDYGLVGMMAIFIAIAQLFIDGGLGNALIRTKSPSDKDYSTVFVINLTLSTFFYILLYFSAPFIADYYDQPILKSLLRTVALVLVIGSISCIQSTQLTIRVDFRTRTYISILISVISGIVGIVCAYKGLGVWALIAQTLASSIVCTIATLAFVHWRPKLAFSRESFKRLFSYSSKMLVASIINVIYDNVYPLIIGKRFTAADVGQYTRAWQFPGITNGTITGALNRVAFPVLSQIQDDDDRLLRVYDKYIQLACFLTFPALMGLCGCARPLVSLLLTDKWLGCVPLMQIICFGLLTNTIATINLNLLYVKGRSDMVLKLEIIKKSIAFAIIFITMFFSIKVMCIGHAVYSYLALYLNTHYTKRILGYGIKSQIKSAAPYFLISLVVLVEAALCSYLIHNNVISIVVSLTVCSFTYWLITRMTHLYAYEEVRSILSTILKKG